MKSNQDITYHYIRVKENFTHIMKPSTPSIHQKTYYTKTHELHTSKHRKQQNIINNNYRSPINYKHRFSSNDKLHIHHPIVTYHLRSDRKDSLIRTYKSASQFERTEDTQQVYLDQ